MMHTAPAPTAADRCVEIGRVAAIFRYPVKSMRGEGLETAALGWHGVEGDRRLALRRIDEQGGFPWLTAGRLPALVQFTPEREAGAAADALPTHVRTPEGESLPAFGGALAEAIARRTNSRVEMTHLKHGIFDDASVSVIAAATVDEIARLSATPADVRRFRPNVLLDTIDARAFAEDAWIGGVLTFGDEADAPAVALTLRDARCAMVNLDPESGAAMPEVLKAIVKANANNAGAYGTVTRAGRLAVGQPVFLRRPQQTCILSSGLTDAASSRPL